MLSVTDISFLFLKSWREVMSQVVRKGIWIFMILCVGKKTLRHMFSPPPVFPVCFMRIRDPRRPHQNTADWKRETEAVEFMLMSFMSGNVIRYLNAAAVCVFLFGWLNICRRLHAHFYTQITASPLFAVPPVLGSQLHSSWKRKWMWVQQQAQLFFPRGIIMLIISYF